MRLLRAQAIYSGLVRLKMIEYRLFSWFRKRRHVAEGDFYLRTLYEALYRFMADEAYSDKRLHHHYANKFARMELRELHRRLFQSCKKESTIVETIHSESYDRNRNRVFVTCHTDTMWENIPEIMDAYGLEQLTLVGTKRGQGGAILRRVLRAYSAFQMESDIEAYESLDQRYKNKRIYLLFVEDGAKYFKQLTTLLKRGIPFLIAYDGFPPPARIQDEDKYWVFKYKGRPIVQAPRVLAKLVHRFSLDAVFLYSHRDDAGVDIVKANLARLDGCADLNEATELLYEQFYTFVFGYGVRYETSWQGVRVLSPAIPRLWKDERPLPIGRKETDRLARLTEDVMVVRTPEKGHVLLVKPFPFSAIKVSKEVHKVLRGPGTDWFRNGISKDLITALEDRKYFSGQIKVEENTDG